MERLFDTMGRVLLESSLRGGLILALAGLVTWSLRHRSAALRHAVWLAALMAMLAMPLLALFLPRWSVPVLPARAAPAVRAESGPAASAPSPIGVATESNTGKGAPTESARTPRRLLFALLLVWLAGAVALTAREIASQRRLAWLIGTSRPAMPPGIVRAWNDEVRGARRLGRVVCRMSPRARVPLACGIVRRVVLLPDDATTWDPACLRSVLVHELSHLSRRDPLWTLLARVACAAFWFHPLVWLASAKLRQECERACDDAVVRGGERPSRYAETLLFVASRMASDSPGIALPLARRRGLEGRISEILARRRDLGALGASRQWALGAFATAVVVTVATVQPVTGSTPTPAPDAKAPVADSPAAPDWRPRAMKASAVPARFTHDSHSPVQIADTRVRIVPSADGDDAGVTMPECDLTNDGARRVVAVCLALDLPGNHDRIWCTVDIPAHQTRRLRVPWQQWAAVVSRGAASGLVMHVTEVRFDRGEAWDSGESEPTPQGKPAPGAIHAPEAPHEPGRESASQPTPRPTPESPSHGQVLSAELPAVPSTPARFRNPDGAAVAITEARTPSRAYASASGRAMTAVPAVRLLNRSLHRVVAVKLRYKADPESHAVTVFSLSLEPGASVVVIKQDFETWGRPEDMTVQVVGARFDDGSVWGTFESAIDTRDAWVYPLTNE